MVDKMEPAPQTSEQATVELQPMTKLASPPSPVNQMAGSTAGGPASVYNPVSGIVRTVGRRVSVQPRLTRASHAYYRRTFQLLRSLGKFPIY